MLSLGDNVTMLIACQCMVLAADLSFHRQGVHLAATVFLVVVQGRLKSNLFFQHNT